VLRSAAFTAQVNYSAVEFAMKWAWPPTATSAATTCLRAKYFYPDLPKGCQITQDKPRSVATAT
jgi:Asp-tRNA(Asn)/Glu-tRNA(Gln) amidotransferase B subunit